MIRAWFESNGGRLVVWVVALLVVVASVGLYLVQPHPVDERAVDAVRETPALTVEQTETGYTVRPADGETSGGLVFYPGALVPTRAYLPLAGDIVNETGLSVFVVDVPLNLAVLDVDAANAVLDTHPEIDRWYVGGHSLGGAMACRYADREARSASGSRSEAGDDATVDRLAGVVVVGAYCDVDVRDTDLDVLTVVGTRDSIVNRASLASSRALVSADARFVDVTGMNHTQVGVYSGQADTPGTISGPEARDRVATAIDSWFTNQSGERSAIGSHRQRPHHRRPSPEYEFGEAVPTTNDTRTRTRRPFVRHPCSAR